MKTISVILPVHNQEHIIDFILHGITHNASKAVKELIIILDGCTDSTERVVYSASPHGIPTRHIITPDIWEVKANNVGFHASTCDYSLTVQDDMFIQEPAYDQRLLQPFKQVPGVLAVTARNAQDEGIFDNSLQWFNLAGKDNNYPRDKFGVRDVIVRGPVLWDNAKLEQLNYLDESFVIDSDDKDISLRAWLKYGWVVGACVCDYDSPLAWGTTRKNPESNRTWAYHAIKNQATIIEHYRDYLSLPSSQRHDEDIEIA